MPEKQDPDVKRILDALERDYLLVSVQFCQWSGLHLAEGTSVLRGPTILTESQVTHPRWRLMPKSLKREISRINRKVRRELDGASVPSHFHGLRLAPRAEVPGLFDRLITHRADLDTTLDDLILHKYGVLCAEIEAQLGGAVFATVKAYIPKSSDLRRRFGLGWFAAELVEAKLPKGPGIAAARKRFAEMSRETFENMVQEVRWEVANAATNLAERIEDKGICKQGTIDRARRAFAKLQVFVSLADDDLLAKVTEADQDLETATPKRLNPAIQAEEAWARELACKLRAIELRARDRDVIEKILVNAGWPVPVGP